MSSDTEVIHKQPINFEEAVQKLERQREKARERQRRYYQRKKETEISRKNELMELRKKVAAWEPQIKFLNWIEQEFAGEYDALSEQYQDEHDETS